MDLVLEKNKGPSGHKLRRSYSSAIGARTISLSVRATFPLEIPLWRRAPVAIHWARSMNPPPGSPAYREHTPVRTPTPSTPARDHAALTNAELVQRVAGGDQRALGALYDRQVTLVHSLALRLLGDADDAEDVVEETFWQVWRHASRYDVSRGSVSTWLCSIARSRALDLLRAARRRPERIASAIESDDHSALASASANPLGGVEESEQRALVRGALNELPPEQRESIELAYFGGLSQSEIAERTGQPLGTIKTRIRLAMMKLRARLSSLRERAT